MSCLDKGIEISDLIASSNTEKLKKVFVDGYQMEYLFEVLDDEIMKYENYELNQPNIFYNPFKNQYIYTIYASKWIDNGTDWGLGDYLFVFQIAFVFDDATQKVSVENYRVLKDHVGFKTWWFSFMRSYSENSCRRNLWADSYGIIPPPPPPPVTEDWLQN
ncbi:hypothetical protein [Aquimarina litoralis]|uniref:hypothetical protein n=1 Tax=Aquimarina litoralis TaxID=584605 RepID=UPI001C57DECC|nr:hypothetical protein [Aquimarina litoralis]MBW1296887.1 hypothetical protein [Aquimarina litoralis]